MSAKDPELCAKYCPGGYRRSDLRCIVLTNWFAWLVGVPREAPLSIFDQYKEVSEKLKIFSEVVLEALLRSADSWMGESSREGKALWDCALVEEEELWDCALAEEEELGAMAILHDKVLTLLY